MASVVVSIPELGVRGKSIERNREIYVLSLAADNRGADPGRNEVPIAAHNETLPNVAPGLQKHAALQFVLCMVSNTFPRIRKDLPLSLSGSGILLYPNLDPKGLLAMHFVVIECDQKTRDLGRTLDGILGSKPVRDVVTRLVAGVTQPLQAGLMSALVEQIPKTLANNEDDLLFAHSHSGFDFDKYGLEPGESMRDYAIGNDKVRCKMRVRVN
jgi:hypothetical protein